MSFSELPEGKTVDSTATQAVKVETIQPNIALVTLDMPGSSANVLTTDLFAELEDAFSDLQQRTEFSGLILYSAKPSIFVAGADLKRINSTLNWPDEQIIKFCEDGRAIMRRLSQMPFPTVAAINGACVGGGLEITLWCDYRIASDDRKTILGLPEVKLGLVPGWAGTVRLPRIASLEAAVDLVTSGKVVKAEQALEMGFVDQVTSKDELIESAVALIERESFESSEDIRNDLLKPVERVGNIDELQTTYGQRIQANHDIFPFACNLVLDHLLDTAAQDHDVACHGESLAMAKVYGSPPSYGLLNHFFLGEHNRKKPGFVDVKLADKQIGKVGFVGVGLMGKSIAENCIKAGNDVVLLDASEESLASAFAELNELAQSKNVSCVAAKSYDDFKTCDLVIESVVEVAEVKRTVLEKIGASVSPSTIIATNTSAIPLNKMSGVFQHPENFCGIHFCHPELMLLVEVVAGEQSSPATMANVTAWVRKLRKMPVVVKDRSGFVVNRLLAAMLDQAFRLYSLGFSILEIDAAMRDFGFLGGPFEIVDVIGSEVCMYAGREMFDGGVKCVTLSPILPRLVKRNLQGRKSGKGFYRYESQEGEAIWNEDIDQILESYVDDSNKPNLTSTEIAEAICSGIVLEASRILDDGIASDPRDVDLSIINGFSFPMHQGGILFWADRVGISKINTVLKRFAAYDEKLQPNSRMLDMEENEVKFYD